MTINVLESRYVEFINNVNEKYPITVGYLFGSRAKHTENAMSDIDIALLFKNTYDESNDAFIRGEIIESGFEFFKLPVDIVSLNLAPLSIKYEIIKEGILIFDHSPVQRVEFETKVLQEYLDFKYYSDSYNATILESIRNNDFFGGI